MTTYVGNALSLQMLPGTGSWQLTTTTLSAAQAGEMAYYAKDEDGREGGQWVSFFGHEDVARLAAASIGVPTFDVRRVSVQLKDRDSVLVAQYSGPRLPEGATHLPEGAEIQWRLVRVSQFIPGQDEAQAAASAATLKAAEEAAYQRGFKAALLQAAAPPPSNRELEAQQRAALSPSQREELYRD